LAFDLSSFNFFKRTYVKEYLTFACRTLAERSQSNLITSVPVRSEQLQLPLIISAVNYPARSNLGCVAIVQEDFPRRMLSRLFHEILSIHQTKTTTTTTNSCATILKRWQTIPTDKLDEIKDRIDEVKEIMAENIEAVIARGQSIDELVVKSSDLSDQSKRFFKKAKETNRCCKVW
jgi:synaptobrevin homolog YKT6